MLSKIHTILRLVFFFLSINDSDGLFFNIVSKNCPHVRNFGKFKKFKYFESFMLKMYKKLFYHFFSWLKTLDYFVRQVTKRIWKEMGVDCSAWIYNLMRCIAWKGTYVMHNTTQKWINCGKKTFYVGFIVSGFCNISNFKKYRFDKVFDVSVKNECNFWF